MATVSLDFFVLEAQGLPKPPKGHQMPSCIVEIAGADVVQTESVKKTQDPTWNTRFHFEELHLDGPVLPFSVRVVERSREISRAAVKQPLENPEAGLRIDPWIELAAEGLPSGGRLHVGISILRYEPDPQDEPAPEVTPEEGAAAAEHKKEDERQLSLRTKVLFVKLQHDEEDPGPAEEEAKAGAARKYKAFLRAKTPLLLDNAERANQIRTEAEAD